MSKFDELSSGKAKEEDTKKREETKKGEETKGEGHHQYKEIKIKFKPILIERILYYVIILVLIALLTISYFGERNCGQDGVVVKEGTTTTTPTTTTNDTNASTETTTGDGDTSDDAGDGDAGDGDTSDDSDTDANIDADLIFVKSDVILDDANSKKVSEIKYKIHNKGSVLRAKVDVVWYDEGDSTAIKTKIRSSAYTIVPAGQTVSKTITSFRSSYLGTDDNPDSEKVLLKLYDSSNDELLSSKKVTVTTT